LTGGQHFRTWKGVRGDYVLPFIISARYWIEVAAGGKNWYRQRVIQAGASPLFRQAFVEARVTATFQPAGYIAALPPQPRLASGHSTPTSGSGPLRLSTASFLGSWEHRLASDVAPGTPADHAFVAIPPPKAADGLCPIPTSEKTFGPSRVTSKNFSNTKLPLPRRRRAHA
jgi:hypothetical protein